MVHERWIHSDHVMCGCCYANSGGNRGACWQFFLPSSYECLLLWRKLFTVHKLELRNQKNPRGLQAATAGNASNFPFDFSAFYLTFIDSGDSGWCCPCFFVFCFTFTKLYTVPLGSCGVQPEPCAGGLRALFKGCLPVSVEGGVIVITFFQIFLSITGFR